MPVCVCACDCEYIWVAKFTYGADETGQQGQFTATGNHSSNMFVATPSALLNQPLWERNLASMCMDVCACFVLVLFLFLSS